jgi:hypothetical protein
LSNLRPKSRPCVAAARARTALAAGFETAQFHGTCSPVE